MTGRVSVAVSSWGVCAADPSQGRSTARGRPPAGGRLVAGLDAYPFRFFVRKISVSERHIALLDHFIRPPQQRRRDRQAERLGGLEVDDQLEFGRLLHGEIGGLRAFQDLVDVLGRSTVQLTSIPTVRHQSSHLHPFPGLVHRRKPELRREVGNLSAEAVQEWIPEYEQTTCAGRDRRLEMAWHLVGATRFEDLKTGTVSFRGCLDLLERQPCEGRLWVHQHGDHLLTRTELLQELEVLASNLGQAAQAGDVPTGPAEAADEPGTYRIADGREHDRDGHGGRLRRLCRECPEAGYQHVRPASNQLHSQLWQSF